MDVKRFAAFLLIIALGFGLIGFTSPGLIKQMRLGLDLKGGFEILYVASPIDESQQLTKEVIREAARSLEKRANANGAEEPEVLPEGSDRIRVRIAGVTDQEYIRKILKEPALLTFRSFDGTIELRGDDFVENGAKVQFDESNLPVIAIKLKDKAKFFEVTSRIAKYPAGQNGLGIYLNEEMISNPNVNFGIDSTDAIISGSFSFKEAQELAGTINLGALPVKLTEKYTQVVDATLGQASLEKTLEAGLIGSAFIILFMLLVYRLPGVVSIITLAIYTWLLLYILKWMNATLTLPGIAAFVLGMGMAVDANIITYERVKEEIRSGKSLMSAIKAGSKHSMRTIMDANITTIIAGWVLFFLGTGSIKGFALVLITSILVSVLTNVFLSRFLLNLLAKGLQLRKVSYFGVKEADIREL